MALGWGFERSPGSRDSDRLSLGLRRGGPRPGPGFAAGQPAPVTRSNEDAEAHEAAVRRADELAALLRATRVVMSGLDLQETLARIAHEAAQIAGTPHIKILIADHQAGVLRMGACLGGPVPADFAVKIGHSYSGRVAATGEPLFVPDTPNDPTNLLAARDREHGIRTYLGLPIKLRDTVLGVR